MEKHAHLVWIEGLDARLPHASNLRTKLQKEHVARSGKREILDILIKITEKYKEYTSSLRAISTQDHKLWIQQSLSVFESYYSEIKSTEFRVFSHQSDFLSSLLPEYLLELYTRFITSRYTGLSVDTQKELIIDLSFLPSEENSFVFKTKRVDVAIVRNCPLSVGEELMPDFNIPVIAVEVKTNLDKNMISGVEYSVQRLKRTFPLCKYFLFSEFADFAIESQNYAASSIDEILIGRKQKRSDSRREESTIRPIDSSLVIQHIEYLWLFLDSAVLISPPNLENRMKNGKLIF